MTTIETTSEFVISRTFNAPRAKVWKGWTDAAHLAEWWGPKGFKATVKKLDLRPGGLFHYFLKSPQGQDMWGRFVYREIIPGERLVFISSFSDENAGLTRHPRHEGWPLQLLSTITFDERDGKTTVTVRWEPYEASGAERETFASGHASMQGGWTGTLDQLNGHLEHVSRAYSPIRHRH
ncbi:MAG: SRPBCC family protein [Methyloceanibacter sp.]